MPDGHSSEDRAVGAVEAVGAVLRACTFAAAAHSRNRRKGAAQEPYVEHLLEVTRILSDCGAADDLVLLQAAMLHDTLEDTRVTTTELVEAFGRTVADIVGEMSDDATLPKEERKRLQVEEASRLSARARQIKVADKISNLRGLIVSPSAHWEHGRKVEYFHWAKAAVVGCRGVNPALDALVRPDLRRRPRCAGGAAPAGAAPPLVQTLKTVEPVVLRASRSRWAWAASASG